MRFCYLVSLLVLGLISCSKPDSSLSGDSDGPLAITSPTNASYLRTRAELIFQFPREETVQLSPSRTILSSLTVVGVFANNGVYYSAPAFITGYGERGY